MTDAFDTAIGVVLAAVANGLAELDQESRARFLRGFQRVHARTSTGSMTPAARAIADRMAEELLGSVPFLLEGEPPGATP